MAVRKECFPRLQTHAQVQGAGKRNQIELPGEFFEDPVEAQKLCSAAQATRHRTGCLESRGSEVQILSPRPFNFFVFSAHVSFLSLRKTET